MDPDVAGDEEDAAPRFTGHVAWRGLVPAERLPKGAFAPTVTAWMGPRKHFVHYFVRRGELLNFVGVVEDQEWREESWVSPGDPAATGPRCGGRSTQHWS